MAQLSAAQKDEVKAQIMRVWSQDRTPVPVTKPDLDTLMTFMDEAMEAAETDVISRIPGPHPARSWLLTNQDVARRILIEVEFKRREVL